MNRLLLSPQGIVRNGLVSEYRFDEGSGQVLYDYRNNNNGRLGSTTGVDTNDPTWSSLGLSFATNDYVNLGTPLATISNNITLGIVLRFTASDDGQNPVSCHLFQTGGYNFRTIDNKLYLITQSAGAQHILASVSTISGYFLNKWVYVAGVVRGVGGSIYVDGKIENNSSTLLLSASPQNLALGSISTGDSGFFTGDIAHFSVYNRALSTTELDTNYRVLRKTLAGRGITI